MDTGRNDLKTLTDLLRQTLEAHTQAIKDGMDSRKLYHGKIIDGLMKKIENYQPPTQQLPTSPIPSTQPIEVLHGASTDISAPQQAIITPEIAPEGAKDRTHIYRVPVVEAEKVEENTTIAVPFSDQPNTPPSKAKPIVLQTVAPAIKPQNQPKVVDGVTLTPDNVDEFAELMGDDSLQEPVIEGVKAK